MTATERQARTQEADALCVRAWAACGGGDQGMALVAVGGYGRGELAPCSDLDVVLVHDDGEDPGGLATEVWYPLWDSGARIDHAVRSVGEMVERAGADVRVALGLLDVRHLAGDPNLTVRLRTAVLAHWRSTARESLPRLRELTERRHERAGELAHASVPDLKEAHGGLRDTTVLAALTATWLVDVPPELARARGHLLDVRDALHAELGRASDRVAPEVWEPLAKRMEWADAPEAQTRVRELGRRVTHLSRLCWRRVDGALARPSRTSGQRGPSLEPIAPGLAVAAGEVVLDRRARPSADPCLLLRAAAEAAERDLALSPYTAARLMRDGAALPTPWPDEARHLLVRLLLAGRGLLAVWETLDETGALERLLPEWDRIRLLPHASPIHRFTVDRHVVETCIEAAGLVRQASRPDLLALAALLHDIGKGELVEHSVAGEPIARAVVERMGFGAPDADVVARLVRHHLVLARLATTRDPDDPATAEALTHVVPDVESLSLLACLTEADARATSPQAWTPWRAALVRTLVVHAAHRLVAVGERSVEPRPRAVPIPELVRGDPAAISFTVQSTAEGSRVTAVAQDRRGLLADVGAVLALQRSTVRRARAWSQDEYAVSQWELADPHVEPAVLRQRFGAIVSGRLDPRERLVGAHRGEATVAVRPEASRLATVLEVRAGDRPGLVHVVCAALASCGVDVVSAHIDTVGPQAVDVFYLREESAGPLGESRAAEAAHAVRAALE